MTKKIEVIQPSGIIDGISGNELRQQVIELVNRDSKIILLDCQNITFMNSAGIGALVAALKIVRNSGGDLFICSLNNQVEMIFKITKMNRIFHIFTNREECQKFTETNI